MTQEISIIIPCYRMENYIERSIRSLLAQTYPHWRAIIISDDGIDYIELLKKLGIEDKRLKLVYTGGVATGVSCARNTGLRACQTDYIATLDGDDAFAPDRLEKIVPLLDEHPLIMTDLLYIDDKTQEAIFKHKLLETNQLVDLNNCHKIMLYGAATWAFNKKIIPTLWKENIKAIEDSLWTIKAYDYVEAVYFITEPSYYYYRRNNSLAHSSNTPQLFQQAKQKILNDIANGNLSVIKQSTKDYAIKFFNLSLETEKEYERQLNAGKDVIYPNLFIEKLTESINL